jgi:hypothetical protein
MDRAVLVLLALVLLDSVSTYLLAQRCPVELELSPIVRRLLHIDKRLVLAWAPVEYLVLLGLLYLNKKVRERLGVKKRIEYSVIVLVAVAAVSNTIGVLFNYMASILRIIKLFLPA